jgi:hypothetical protein
VSPADVGDEVTHRPLWTGGYRALRGEADRHPGEPLGLGLELRFVAVVREPTHRRRITLRAVPLVDRLVGLSRLRVLRPLTREIIALYRAPRS